MAGETPAPMLCSNPPAQPDVRSNLTLLHNKKERRIEVMRRGIGQAWCAMRTSLLTLTCAVVLGNLITWPMNIDATESGDVGRHAEQSFNELGQVNDRGGTTGTTASGTPKFNGLGGKYSPDHYWIGTGEGDLTKGKSVCQRVSELSARTDLAKQIRVMVKEHMVDRVRERSGGKTEQDIELTREEIVQEYLLGVTIVDRRVDEENKTCTATAIMPKTPVQPQTAEPNTGPLQPR